MGFRIVWTEKAAEDMQAIVAYIAVDNPRGARRVAQKVLDRVERAAAFPLAGRVLPEKQDGSIREIQLSPYRIIYTVDDSNETIFVARVWHAARGNPDIR